MRFMYKGPSYIAELKLWYSPYNHKYLGKCFRCCEWVEQALQAHAAKQLRKLRQDKAYLDALRAYGKAKETIKQMTSLLARKKPSLSNDERKKAESALSLAEKQKKQASDILNERISYFGLTKSDFESFVIVQQERYKKYVSSHVAQKIASRVLQAIESCLYSKGKKIKFRQGGTLTSFEAKQANSCIRFIRDGAYAFHIEMDGGRIRIPTKHVRENDQWLQYAIVDYEHHGVFCRIKRVPTNNGWDYYVQLVIHGNSPEKHLFPDGRVGIDIGTSTIATVSEDHCSLEVLDEGVESIEAEIRRLNRAMDRSKRATNPDNYRPDGTIRPGKKKWIKSNRYRKLAKQRKTLYARRARKLKIIREQRANQMLEQGTDVFVEKMNFAALAKRARKTEMNSQGRYKRKKRFGKSIEARAPAAQIAVLKKKLGYIGKTLNEVNTKTFKASQYNHLDDSYQKKQLGQRDAWIGPYHVHIQRDLYSAFLLMNTDGYLRHADRMLCIKKFYRFLQNHNQCIQELLSGAHETISSFGLKAFAA